jgi:tRNA nucleotidyltransferase (CCA-adding enzyme)
MAGNDNLAHKIDTLLPSELADFIRDAGRLAAGRSQGLYLVGGVVRDLLLGVGSLDIDLVVEGDAIALADALYDAKDGKITRHQRFNTAKFDWQDYSIDVASAREESYAHPGALPKVKPGSLEDDLIRRDFSINAMAAGLAPDDYGRLIDPYNGCKDLESANIRILHPGSFIDDSTRIWRGLRYEQRLGFRLEPETLRLLKRDVPMLDGISGDRIRYELECVFKEAQPEKVLRRAAELGVLARLEPSLAADAVLSERFQKAREVYAPAQPPPGVYFALLAYDLEDNAREKLISYLKLNKTIAGIVRDTAAIKDNMAQLADASLKPSVIYRLLAGYSTQALHAGLIAASSPIARQHIGLYMDKLRAVKPMLSGNDLLKLSVPQGPRIKEVLDKLLEARLDGLVKTRDDEERLVRELT